MLDALSFLEGLSGPAWSLALGCAAVFFLFCALACFDETAAASSDTPPLAHWLLAGALSLLLALYCDASPAVLAASLEHVSHHVVAGAYAPLDVER